MNGGLPHLFGGWVSGWDLSLPLGRVCVALFVDDCVAFVEIVVVVEF